MSFITDPELVRRIVREELTRQIPGLTPGAYNWGTVDAAGRVVYAANAGGGGGVLTARVSKDPGAVIATNAFLAGTTVTWTLAYDVGYGTGMYSSGANDRLTAPLAGVYLSTLHILWDSGLTGVRQISIFWYDDSAATSIMIARDTRIGTSDALYQPLCAPPIYMDINDYVYAQVAQNSGSNKSILYVSATQSPTFSLTKIG